MITLTANIAYVIDLDVSNIRSIEGNIADRKDIKMPSWGVVSNGGKMRFVDKTGSIKQMIENRELVERKKVTIFLNNTVSKYQQQIGIYWTRNWEYDNDSKEVSVNITDMLEDMQSIIIPHWYFAYDLVNKTEQSAKDLYEALQSITVDKMNSPKYTGFKMKPFDRLEQLTQDHFSSIIVKFPYIKQGTLWSHWNKFCDLTQSHMYIDQSGEATCKYIYGGT